MVSWINTDVLREKTYIKCIKAWNEINYITCVWILLRPLHHRTCPLLSSISAWSISSRSSISSSSSSGISSFLVPWPMVIRNFSRFVGTVEITWGSEGFWWKITQWTFSEKLCCVQWSFFIKCAIQLFVTVKGQQIFKDQSALWIKLFLLNKKKFDSQLPKTSCQ